MQRTISVASDARKYIENITVGPHTFRADEPVALGGADSAPTPYELLLGALGACTAITVRMFAERRQWPLEQVHVELSHSKVHAADCANCDSPNARLDRVELAIRFVGELYARQRGKLRGVAEH